MKIMVTGAAGFVGYHVAAHLLDRGDEVIAVDNLNSYYDVGLKLARLEQIETRPGFSFVKLDLSDREGTRRVFEETRPERVIHLAAQAGVRYSISNPHEYGESNLTGFLNVLEGCRQSGVAHLVYASSSSVYGGSDQMPFSVDQNVDHPYSLYAATKKANELMAHTYSHLFNLPTTGLRFFTVYGPWGRPDMAYFSFVKAIEEGRAIQVFNHGQMLRDFTYIDDIVEGVVRVCDRVANAPESGTDAPYRIYNIGNNRPVKLMDFIKCIEKAMGQEARKTFLPMQPGDVPVTCADITDLKRDVGFEPSTPIEKGIPLFVEWYREYYREGAGRVAVRQSA